MNDRLTVTAQERTEKNPKKVRKSGFVPAVIYNHGKTNEIQVSSSELANLFDHGITESTLINIKVGEEESQTAFIKDYQLHPVKENILHIDFFRVTFGEKIKTYIPIELIGKPIGVKEGGVLETFLHEVEIETFPRYLTSSLKVNIDHLKIGDSVHLEKIEIPPESKILMEGNPIVCQVSTSAKLESKIEDVATESTAEITEDDSESSESKESK